VRLGTPLFLNGFSCPQPPREVGTRLGPRGRLGRAWRRAARHPRVIYGVARGCAPAGC